MHFVFLFHFLNFLQFPLKDDIPLLFVVWGPVLWSPFLFQILMCSYSLFLFSVSLILISQHYLTQPTTWYTVCYTYNGRRRDAQMGKGLFPRSLLVKVKLRQALEQGSSALGSKYITTAPLPFIDDRCGYRFKHVRCSILVGSKVWC